MKLVPVLLWLMPVLAIGFALVHFRGKTRARRLESEARERTLLDQARSSALARVVPLEVPPSANQTSFAPASVVSPGAAPRRDHGSSSESASSSAPAYAVQGRARPIVDSAGALVFHLLKTSLPECHVFVRVPMTEFFGDDTPGDVGGMHGYIADFVVCSRTLEPLVIVELQSAARRSPSCADFAVRADIHFVALRPENLPRRENVRPLLRIAAPS